MAQPRLSKRPSAKTMTPCPSRIHVGRIRLDVKLGDGFQTSHVNFVVKVTNVTDDGVVLHVLHVRSHDDILVTGGSDEDVTLTDDVFGPGGRLGSLPCAGLPWRKSNRSFRDNDTTARRLQRSGGTTDVTVTGNPASLTGNHDIGGSHDTVGKECLQPYKLLNLHLVAESLALIAGNNNSPCFFCISYNLLTPVVVSSETPTHVSTILCHLFGFVFKLAE